MTPAVRDLFHRRGSKPIDKFTLLVSKIASAPRPLTWPSLRSIFREMGTLGLLDFDPETISPREYRAMARAIDAEVRAAERAIAAEVRAAKKRAAAAATNNREGA
jgi:hypothetical protein